MITGDVQHPKRKKLMLNNFATVEINPNLSKNFFDKFGFFKF